MIPREIVQRILETAKIEEVVGGYVTLRRRGANLIGLCPFHTERTGSFTVSPAKGIYKCFGCGKSGNVAGFVMDIENCSFAEAIKQLGKRYHIEVPEREMTEEEKIKQDDRESMLVVNDFANKWFQEQLWNTPEGQAIGLSYFRERGLTDESIRTYQLGYSPEKGNPLAKALLQKGFNERYIVNDPETHIGTGICGKSQKDDSLYDRFRDRVIFPIFSVSGKTVGFAGRIMKKKENVGKYVNSPDSMVYSKTNELYGLYQARQEISRKNLCYLVEGQMDVISMHQAGIENVVASGGTALTKPQIRLIKRFTSNIIVLYDGDAAGIHAALRGIDMFLEEGFNVKVVLLPDGEDPDSYARSHNASDFIAFIEQNKTDFIRFKSTLLQEQAGGDPQKRSELIHDITQSIAQIPDLITRQVYIKDSASKLQINEQLLIREVIRLRRKTAEEAEKKREEQDRMAAFADQAAEVASVMADGATEQTDKHGARFEENYRNLVQLLVRYGERPLYDMGNGQTISVGDYILNQLQTDNIVAPNALYAQMVKEYQEHRSEPLFTPSTYFKFHENPSISAIAIDMIADRYQLSQMYSRQSISENVQVEAAGQDEAAHLPEKVHQMLLEIKLTVVEQRIDKLEKDLKNATAANDWNTIRQLMQQQPQLMETRSAICKALGNRVIV